MKAIIEILKTRYFQVSMVIALIFLAASIVLPYWRLFPEITSSFAVPLHYNIHSGVDLYGRWERIFTTPIISGIILIVNIVLGIALWRKDKVLSYFFFTVAAIAQVFAFLAMIFVVLLNLSYA